MTCNAARQSVSLALLFAGAISTSALAQSAPVTDVSVAAIATAAPRDQVGAATWYGEEFDGRVTASGEMFDMYRLTAASPTLPLNSMVEVTNVKNGRSVLVRITDRRDPGPGGVIVLSKAAAANLAFIREGSAEVRIRQVSRQAFATPAAPSALAQRAPAEDALASWTDQHAFDSSAQQRFWTSSRPLLVWAPVQLASR
jgi:rare lipoprotein A (peptidoglycan hydrolase)